MNLEAIPKPRSTHHQTRTDRKVWRVSADSDTDTDTNPTSELTDAGIGLHLSWHSD